MSCIGFTCGAFDLLHAGHVVFLRDSKQLCDHLIVGLHVNPQTDRPSKNQPIQSVYERYIQLKGCSYVDEIIPYETELDLYNILATTKIHKRFLGGDYIYSEQKITGDELCVKMNIDTVFVSRYHNYGSSVLRNRIEKNIKDKNAGI
jgi:glycerol-3-phosphate cytidylyltransferase